MDMTLALDAAPSQRTYDKNGFLHVALTPISKAVVSPYLGREIPGWEGLGLKPDKIYHGLRDPTELEKAAPTFNGLPLLLDHAFESAAAPRKDSRVGATGDQAVFEAPYLKNSLHVQDAQAIRAIEDGSYKELSCAYFYQPDFAPGTYEGAKYDFVMRGIKGNHVALVEKGRAGGDVAVADALPPALDAKLKKEKEIDMRNFKNLHRRFLALDSALKEAKVGDKSVKDAAEELSKAIEETDPAQKGAEDGLDLTLPAEELIKQNAGDLASAQELVRQLVAKIQGVQEDDAPPPPEEKAKDKPAPEGKPAAKGKPAPDSAEQVKKEDKKGAEDAAPAQDTAAIVAEAVRQTEQRMQADMRARLDAADECRTFLGNINGMAFDSAEAIYQKALAVAGVDCKNYPKEAYRGMVAAFRQGKPAMDAKPLELAAQKTDVNLDSLSKITIL